MPKGTRHPKWPEVVEFVDALGVKLDKWQWLVLRASLLRKGGRWAAFTVGVCAPRQNGKDGILEVRELVGARILGEKLADPFGAFGGHVEGAFPPAGRSDRRERLAVEGREACLEDERA